MRKNSTKPTPAKVRIFFRFTVINPIRYPHPVGASENRCTALGDTLADLYRTWVSGVHHRSGMTTLSHRDAERSAKDPVRWWDRVRHQRATTTGAKTQSPR
jgi:hypothetical protein